MTLQIRYFFGESIRTFIGAKWLSVVSVITIGLVLALSVCFGIMLWYIHSTIARAEGEMGFEVFIEDNYSSSDSSDILKQKIEAISGITNVDWISKDSAIHIFRRRYGSEMLEAIEENPLPSSFHVSLSSASRCNDSMSVIKSKIQTIKGVEEISYSKEWFSKLKKIRKIFFFITLGVGFIAILAFYWVVSNSIRFTIFSRREHIEIMRLIGATSSFIKIPFYLEGIYSGFLGSLNAFFILYVVYKILVPSIPNLVILSNYYSLAFFSLTFAGIALAVFCSKVAIKKYLA